MVYDNFKNIDPYDQPAIFTTNQLYDDNSFGPKTKFPILYKGIGLTINKNEFNNIFGILRGDNTTFSYNPSTGQTSNYGHNIVLVAAVQGKNNARCVLTGSIEMLSNNFLKKTKKFSNKDYINKLIQWNFQIAGQLKLDNIKHFMVSDKTRYEIYKPYDEIRYEIDIQYWDETS